MQAQSLEPEDGNQSQRRGGTTRSRSAPPKKGWRQGTSLPIDNRGPSMCASLSTLIRAMLKLWPMSPPRGASRRVCPGGFKFGVSAARPMTTFYPFRPCERRQPDSMFAIWRTEEHLGGQPHLISGASRHPAPCSGGPHQVRPKEEMMNSTLSAWKRSYRIAGCAFNSAPSGNTPVSKNRHNAIRSFRANAMIPILRSRLLP